MTRKQIEINKIKKLEKEIEISKSEKHKNNCLNAIKIINEKIKNMNNLDEEIYYGIYNNISKKFVFGIKEKSKTKATNKLFEMIGKDAYKYRFVVRALQ